ncbi:MAG: TetM/TetW/TetO/TetS family tetracycline resistance ribosomal protection protein [Bacteroides sp.]|nr:TetM/TetW/TetO/TetS family tetracycline resistance ribosomal protection protein [Bacteroides sp.]MCM1549551.1 TetM/TetW/TetO/TetS family tetracycline resistance ribosomal protection protein [Clostridium sp.]
MKKRLVIGILAHVDAGKTTLSEGLLYLCGSIRTLGRVDHKDAFLDTYAMERARGITIFSKQAELGLGDMEVTLLDTPGHVDFSAEMERTLQVLDYAILVINGADGVQGHTRTLWKLLKQYGIPVFLFINKMDQPGTNREKLLTELKGLLDDRCLDFAPAVGADAEEKLPEEFLDALAMCDEALMEEFLAGDDIETASIRTAIQRRNVFPCFFGSALKLEGVEALIQGISLYVQCPEYGEEFGARVYKISRDAQGNRLTHLKITGGFLKVKTLLTHHGKEEKADQLRIYSGSGFRTETQAEAGTICAVTGLEASYCGEGLGMEEDSQLPVLEPVLNYQVLLPEACDVHKAWKQLQQLEEENPLLHMEWQEGSSEIHVQVMGEVELEILKGMIQERFGLEVTFGQGSLVYKETIAAPVEGVGHFEPLRHYAEVHLLMEPGEPGSGLQLETQCSEDMLNRNWQRLILTHLEERKHPGVLTGSEITDMKLTLVAGRAHQKHTEGGDFRQATYRAVRQGLRKADCVLLEPVYEFRLEVPMENSGRAMADIQRMYGSCQPLELEGELAVLTGVAPVSTMSGYQSEVNAYTRGCGKLFCSFKGYMPCHNTEEIIEQYKYDPESDVENPTGSVFCAHGAGFIVPWNQVEDYMHVESGLRIGEDIDGLDSDNAEGAGKSRNQQKGKPSISGSVADEEELKAIFERTYGSGKQRSYGKQDYDNAYENYEKEAGIDARSAPQGDSRYQKKSRTPERKEEFLLVDGYNILFAWEELKELSKTNLEAARGRLMDILCNYQGYRSMNLILVFDAYKVPGNPGELIQYHNIHVVYTKEAETADQYIEKLVHDMGKQYDVTVATSDGLEQLIIYGAGARRMSARGLWEEIQRAEQEMREKFM